MTRVATATSSQIAADAARAVADEGGNAIDCAIAAALVTMNTEPGVCALAGGAYLTIWPATGDPVTIDGNVAVPGLGAESQPVVEHAIEMEYGGGVRTLVGASSVGVPGTPAALELASERYGRLPWEQLFAPTIDCAQNGFPLSRACHYYLGYSGRPIFGRSDDGYFALHEADGTLKPRGTVVTVPHLADSLEQIAREGSRAFYEGDIAERLVTHCREGGGRLSRADLAGYTAEVRVPLRTTLGDWQLANNPPPAVGGVVLAAMLGAFRALPVERWTADSVARLVDVQRAVLRHRRDRLDLSNDVDADARALLAAIANSEFPGRHTSSATVHTSAVDDAGNACALTASAGYGSGEMPAGTGLWLNNCLGEIELNRHGLDASPAGRRLPSNMAPGTARNGRRVLAYGSPGADRITSALQQFLLNFLQLGLPLDEAVAAPRLHVELHPDGDRLAAEAGLELPPLDLPVKVYPELNMYFGGVGAALFDGADDFALAADPRRAGGTCIGGS